MKRALILLLALCLFTASCGSGDTQTSDETTLDTETTSDSDDEYKLNLPSKNYDGYTVTYLTINDYCNRYKLNIAEENGDYLNDAAYKRDTAVSELLGVKFSAHEVPDEGQRTTSYLSADIMADDNTYDFVVPHPTAGLVDSITSGLLYDWNELEYVDFSKPWWNTAMQDSLSINGKVLFASGDIVITNQGTAGFVFNKDYIKNYGISTDLYQLVYDGKWTIDQLNSIIKDVSQDLNGDTEMNENDQYGLLLPPGTTGILFGGMGHITKVTDDGYYALDMDNEKMYNLVDKLYGLVNSGDTYVSQGYSYATFADSQFYDILSSGHSFIAQYDIGGLHTYLRELDFDFGLLPMVKLEEEQDYHHAVAAGLICIPSNTKDPERTGIIAEALAYYSYQYLRPAFFDVVLKNKSLQDEDSYNALTIIHETKVFDFAYNFDSTGKSYNALTEVVINKDSTDFSSYYASIKDSINTQFKNIFDSVTQSN